LVALLAEWSPAIPGLCLYYPGHRHAPPALRAFIEELRSAQRPDQNKMKCGEVKTRTER